MRRIGITAVFARHESGSRRSTRPRPRISVGLLAAACALSFVLPGTAVAATDALIGQQWGLKQIGAAGGWGFSTGANVLVGVVDTGVDLNHEDLVGRIAATTNCIGANANPAGCSGSGQDDNGHGTHVAGIIAANKDNGVGIAGVAPSARLLVAKALDATGAGADADVQAGIMWVVDHGAKVVNLSLGDGNVLPLGLGATGGISAPLTTGIEYAWAHGAIPVLAAGNNAGGLLTGLGGGVVGGLLGSNASFGALHAIIVGATGPTGAMAPYSSLLTNDQWAVAAPGGANDGKAVDDVLSTYWVFGKTNQYTSLAGTSMATPHVAGAVADVLAAGSGQQAAILRIVTTADKGVKCGLSCAGLLDLSAALGGPATPAPPGAGASAGTGTDLLGSLLHLLGLA